MMKQLFLTFMAMGMLATASWAGSEVETPMPITPEHETACTARTWSEQGTIISYTADDCVTAKAGAIALLAVYNYLGW